MVLKDSKVPMTLYKNNTHVIHFPVKSPDDAVTESEEDTMEQLLYWLHIKKYYTEHNPSATIKYHDTDILKILQWVWEHKKDIGGITFLPQSSNAGYDYLPIEQITRQEYELKISEFPEIDFSLLAKYEKYDQTTVAQEIACSAGNCDII